MARFLIRGGKRLKGKIKVGGNKNSALGLIPASLLADSPTTLTNVPNIRDVQVMCELVQKLGGKVGGTGTNTLTIDPTSISSYILDPALSSRIRASVVLAAPLLVKFGRAVITPPGGDQIGERLLDTHFSLMREMGVDIKSENGRYEMIWKKKKISKIFLEEASVTATIMGLIMASSSPKTFILEDAASEPHIKDLALMLEKMGSRIRGAGTNFVEIKGNGKLKGVEHQIFSDDIEGGTFAIAAALTGGDVLIDGIVPDHYPMILHYLSHMGVKVHIEGRSQLRVLPSKLVATKKRFQTRPWPGFPTDLMSPFIVLATQTQGTVLCHDWMYEWRIFFVDDLISMGANIFIADPHRVIVTGPTQLHADQLHCKDIRAGISIVLAALCASGESSIEHVEIIERGYEDINTKFAGIGAEIKKVNSSS